MLNRILIMGRLSADPILRRTQTGTPVASFSLAVDRDFKDKQTGERAVDFIDVVAWRQKAEFVAKYFSKGSMAVVDGRLEIQVWTDKEGNKRRSAQVVAENIYFGGARRESDGGNAPESSLPPYEPTMDGDAYGDLSDDDGDLPF